jgi:Uma2 family endonuclease
MPLVSPLSIDDFERLPHDLAENHELVNGELVDVSGNTGNHNALRDLLVVRLFYVKERQLGSVLSEQEYKFDSNAHAPDVSFFGREKAHLYNGALRVQRFVPDLTIEIVSQNDPFARLIQKAERYRKCGTQEAWIFDIDSRKAFVFSESRNAILSDNDLFASSLLPGFSIRIGELFDRP